MAARRQIRHAILITSEIERRRSRGPSAPSLPRLLVRQRIPVGPLDRIPRHPQIALIHVERIPAHLLPKRRESRIHRPCQSHPRIGRPRPRRPRRPHLRRPFLRVNSDLRTGPQQQRCRSQPQRSAADNRDLALAQRHRLFGRNRARSPRKRPAASAMPIVMNNSLVADLFDVQPRSRRAERPKANRDAEDPIGLRANRRDLQRRSRRDGRSMCDADAARKTRSSRGREEVSSFQRWASNARLFAAPGPDRDQCSKCALRCENG